MTGLLASVANLAEARLVAECGVAIIDLKNPRQGALGALPTAAVHNIVAALDGVAPVSATIGDLAMQPEAILPAVEAMAATGVEYVKLGFFPGGDWPGVIDGLRPVAGRGVRLIAVLFADQAVDLAWLAALADAGFAGAMLDTADKRQGSLTRLRDVAFLAGFVAAARHHRLLCGLAGSLRAEDVAPLAALAPDYLGFRGALCDGDRVRDLNPAAVQAVGDRLRHARRRFAATPSSFHPPESSPCSTHYYAPPSSCSIPKPPII